MGVDGKHRPLVAAALAAWLACPAAAECRLALVLAMDVSASVVASEYRLMMEGTAAALRAPEVRAALLDDRPVAMAAFAWAGVREQALIADWSLLRDAEAIEAFAAGIAGFRRPGSDALDTWWGLTAVGAALLTARELLDLAPLCDAQTVDLAGDGINNDGPEPGPLRALHFDGMTINALAVAGHDALVTGASPQGAGALSDWFRGNVMHGPGAFVEEAHGFPAFERAMTRKLLRELRPPLIGQLAELPPG
jgi:hypothetical protein